jgi:uncharacterized protein (TIGR02246 family)
MVFRSSDEQSVRQVATANEQAWNKHDMDALAPLFTDDAEWVNIVGMWWRGLPEVKLGTSVDPREAVPKHGDPY